MSEDWQKDQVGKLRTGAEQEPGETTRGGLGSRARNRTVMLTPDKMGQVRAAYLGGEGERSKADPLSDILPPMGNSENRRGIAYAPPSEEERGEEPRPEFSTPGEGRFGFGANTQVMTVNQQGTPAANPSFSVRNPAQPSPMVGIQPPSNAQISPSRPTEYRPIRISPVQMAAESSNAPAYNPVSERRYSEPARPAPPPAPAEPAPRQGVVVSRSGKTRLIGFLVSFDDDDKGEVVEMRVGRWLLTSHATDHSDCIVINDASVSPLHAIIRATSDGKIQILDQLSEFGTGVLRAGKEEEEEVTGTMTTVTHGDKVRFGKRSYLVCLLPVAA